MSIQVSSEHPNHYQAPLGGSSGSKYEAIMLKAGPLIIDSELLKGPGLENGGNDLERVLTNPQPKKIRVGT